MGEVRTKMSVQDKSSASLQRIADRLEKLERTMNNVANNSAKTASAMDKVSKSFEHATKTTNSNTDALGRYSKSAQRATNQTNMLITKLRRLASTYLGVMGGQALVNASDAITSSENRLGTIYDQIGGQQATGVSRDQFTQESLDKMYESANRARTGYIDMAKNVSKSMVLANEAFDNNIDNAIRFQEIMAEAYSVGGASAAEQASSMYQMVQALGSGILQGDELRSVREGAAVAYNAIEKYAQGVYNSTESLKDMASQGMITSDLVVAAILNAGETIDEQFMKTQMTFGQMWTRFKNDVTKAFEPALQKMNELANSPAAKELYLHMVNGINMVSQAFIKLMDITQVVINFIADNWMLVRTILLVIVALVGVNLVNAFVKAGSAALSFVSNLSRGQLIAYGVAAALAVLVGIAWAIYDATGSITMALGYLLVALSGVAIVVALMTSGITMWVAAAMAGILLVAGLFIAFTGTVMGGLYAIGAVFQNIGAFIVNLWLACMAFLSAAFGNAVKIIGNYIVAFWNYWTTLVDNIQLAWNNGMNWCMQKISEMVAWALNKLADLAEGFNSLFGGVAEKIGIDIDVGKIRGLANSASSTASSYGSAINTNYGSLVDAFTDGLGTFEMVDETAEFWDKFNTLNYKDILESWDKGYALGSDWQDSIAEFFNGIGDKAKDFLGFGDKANSYDGTLNPSAPAFDPSGILGDAGKDIEDTAKNTDKIADSMELSQEDLEYLRKVAEMEWKKQFTTASVVVNMENNNVVNNESDLNGIVIKLADALESELNIVANGVYT